MFQNPGDTVLHNKNWISPLRFVVCLSATLRKCFGPVTSNTRRVGVLSSLELRLGGLIFGYFRIREPLSTFYVIQQAFTQLELDVPSS